jgi:hypothetical protein
MTTKALVAALVGALAAAVLGLLTFGAQATVSPDHVPLAVSAPSPEIASRIAGQGGDHVSWRVVSPSEGRKLLADKEVYGVLELGSPTSVVLSGAVNPAGTQVAQQILTTVASLVPGAQPPQVVTLHPASTAGRVAPLAGSALLWIAGLVAGLLFVLMKTRSGTTPGVFALLLRLWDSSLPLGWDVLAYLLLAALAFTGVQGALLRVLGFRAAAVLGPLYLIAPAVAGQVPELLHPFYRDVLWSWTPFRFAAEGVRSLLQGTASAPDVRTGLIVLGSMAVAGLIVILLPGRRSTATTRSTPEVAPLPAHVG